MKALVKLSIGFLRLPASASPSLLRHPALFGSHVESGESRRPEVSLMCERCRGTGRCRTCDGTGHIDQASTWPDLRRNRTCAACYRSGRCQLCYGNGSFQTWH